MNTSKSNNNQRILTNIICMFTLLVIFENVVRTVIGSKEVIVNILKLLFCGILFIYIFFIKHRIIIKNVFVHIWFILFFALLLFKVGFTSTSSDFLGWLSQNNNINYFLWYAYFFIFSQIRDEINYKKIIKFLRINNFIVIIISIFFFLTDNYFGLVPYQALLDYGWPGTRFSRMMSIFVNPNHAGLYFFCMLILLDSTNGYNKKNFLKLENILLILCNVLTFSRTSLVCMAIYIVLRNSIYDTKTNMFLSKTKCFFIFIAGIAGIGYAVKKLNVYFFSLKYLLNSSRIERWLIGIKFLKQNPFLGTPFNTEIKSDSIKFGELTFSDNMFVEIGARFGIFLCFILIVYLIVLFIKAIVERNWGLVNKLQTAVIPSLLSGSLHFSVPMYLFILYLFIAENIKFNEINKNEEQNEE